MPSSANATALAAQRHTRSLSAVVCVVAKSEGAPLSPKMTPRIGCGICLPWRLCDDTPPASHADRSLSIKINAGAPRRIYSAFVRQRLADGRPRSCQLPPPPASSKTRRQRCHRARCHSEGSIPSSAVSGSRGAREVCAVANPSSPMSPPSSSVKSQRRREFKPAGERPPTGTRGSRPGIGDRGGDPTALERE